MTALFLRNIYVDYIKMNAAKFVALYFLGRQIKTSTFSP